MITETKGYKTFSKSGDVSFHVTLEEAQQYAIGDLLLDGGIETLQSSQIAILLIKRKSELLTILTGQRGKDKKPRKSKNNPDLIAPRPG